MSVLRIFTAFPDFRELLYLDRFMLVNVNENFFGGLPIQLNRKSLEKSRLCHVDDIPRYP